MKKIKFLAIVFTACTLIIVTTSLSSFANSYQFDIKHYSKQIENRKKFIEELKSKITCPNCGHKKEEIMPTNACEFFYECENCKKRLRPLEGDCCVYCSYGSVKCPPIQVGTGCC